jgi:hypothetical protein
LAICPMFVDGHDFSEALCLQSRDQVLADQARCPSDDDASGCGGATLCAAHHQSFVRKKIGRGKNRMIAMIIAQYQGQ